MKMQIIACEKFPPYQVMRKLNEMSLRLTEFLGVSSFFFYERHPDLLDTAKVSLKKEGNGAYKTFKQMPLLPAAPAALGVPFPLVQACASCLSSPAADPVSPVSAEEDQARSAPACRQPT